MENIIWKSFWIFKRTRKKYKWFWKEKSVIIHEKKQKSHQDATKCYIYGEKITKNFSKDKNHQKVKDHCHFTGKYRSAAHSIRNLRFNVPNEVPVVFHNDSNHDYHFIIKELAKKFERQFECLGENTEKVTFSVAIKKEIKKIDEDDNENIVTISYKITFIDSARFMASSILDLVNNLVEAIHKIKCKDCNYFLE